MREKFSGVKNIATKALEAADKFLGRVLENPQPYEIALQNLTHKPNCSRSAPPVKVEQEEFINLHGGTWGINIHPIPIKRNYIECGECHAVERYSE